MQTKFDQVIQWVGAIAIVSGHTLNTLIEYNFSVRPWNILSFSLGTIAFLIWALRVRNSPQILVNIVSMTICALGLYRAF